MFKELLLAGMTIGEVPSDDLDVIYRSLISQVEQNIEYEFQQIPDLRVEYPSICDPTKLDVCSLEVGAGVEGRVAASHFCGKYICEILLNPDWRAQGIPARIGHELGHQHFTELGHWREWPEERRDWGKLLSEAYAEWVGCTLVDSCDFYRTGGSQEFPFHPGNIPRPSFWPLMEELFEKGGLEAMMRLHPTTIPPPNEWYIEIKERL